MVQDNTNIIAREVLDNYDNPFIVIRVECLNVRERPNSDSEIIATLDEYSGGEILEETGAWVRVKSGDIIGYVSNAYIISGEAAEDRIVEHAEQLVRIDAESGLNIRNSAESGGEIIDHGSKDSLWEYLGEEDGFYRIRYDGDTVGYVSMDYCTLGWFLKGATHYNQ